MVVWFKRGKSNDCANDDNVSGSCQTPVTHDSLTVALAVCIPVAVVCVVLGFFLFKNYRKNRKEAMDHDPEFDENGEATVLPEIRGKDMDMNDPFHNRNSIYPPRNLNKSNTSLPMGQADGYYDNIGLPYHHQMDSKASLDDFAKQIGDYSTIGTPRASIYARGHSSRPSLTQNSRHTSPQKSNLNTVKDKKEDGNFDSDSSVRNSDDLIKEKDGKYETASENSSTDIDYIADKYQIKYENESQEGIESIKEPEQHHDSEGEEHEYTRERTLEPQEEPEQKLKQEKVPERELEHEKVPERKLDQESVTGEEEEREQPEYGPEHPEQPESPSEYLEPGYEEQSPVLDPSRQPEPSEPPKVTLDLVSPFDNENEASFHGEGTSTPDYDVTDSDFANSTSIRDEQADLLGSQLEVPTVQKKRHTPRLSAFTLAGENSDDEVEGDRALTQEQEEELRRMKSVYKVYFDGAKRNASGNSDTSMEHPQGFQYDASQPLPQVYGNEGKINNHLKMDTNYDNRKSTASSVYTQTPVFNDDEQQYYYMQQYYAQNPHPQYQYQYQYQSPQMLQNSFQTLRTADLPPLQQLPHASDIRKSSLQTYTDFRPRAKNQVIPGAKQPFVQIEDDGVWNQSSVSLQSPNSSYQQLAPQQTVPSASQLARSSVVMLNPVTEIQKQRKFKPAGSLGTKPQIPANAYGYNYQYGHDPSQPNGDLIPGNRKSDVRRMMNSNF